MSLTDFFKRGDGYGWMIDGECTHYPSEMFFPGPHESSVAALSVCASCTVVEQCLAFALALAPDGVWGGMSEKQRKAYKQELRDAQVKANEAQGP